MTGSTQRSALVLDEIADDREFLRLHLELMGLLVDGTGIAAEAKGLFLNRSYSVAFIFPGQQPQEGLALCREFKAKSTVPIIMCTSRTGKVTEGGALAAGADDYVVKPIDPRILTLRISQQIERRESPLKEAHTVLTWGVLTLDLTSHRFFVSKDIVELTNAEFRFLQLLMAHPDQVFTRVQIIDAIGSFRGVGSDHIVDNHASRIRKKVLLHGGPDVITVVRSVGFRMGELNAEAKLGGA